MFIISDSKKFIFIHNYKVAGSSIGKSLKKYRTGNIYAPHSQHVYAKTVKKNIPKYIFDNYFKFGFVRNPWDWQVSLYNYMIKTTNHPQHRLIKRMKNFDEYIEWRVNNDLHLQKEFFYDGNICLVDFIGKYENLQEDFKKICNKLNIDANLGHFNKSRENREYLHYYNKKTLEMINKAFREDIKLFNYEKPIL